MYKRYSPPLTSLRECGLVCDEFADRKDPVRTWSRF